MCDCSGNLDYNIKPERLKDMHAVELRAERLLLACSHLTRMPPGVFLGRFFRTQVGDPQSSPRTHWGDNTCHLAWDPFVGNVAGEDDNQGFVAEIGMMDGYYSISLWLLSKLVNCYGWQHGDMLAF